MEGTKTKVKKETGIDLVITNELKKFEISDAFFKKMKSKFSKLKIDGSDDKAGYEKVRLALATTRSTKSSIESKRKEIKEESLKFGRAVDSEARRLQEILSPIDDALREKKRAVDEEKDKIKEEKRAAIERAIQGRSIKLMEIGMLFNGLKYTFDDEVISVAELSIYSDKNFDALVERVIIKVAVAGEEAEKAKKLEEKIENRRVEVAKYIKFIKVDEVNKPIKTMTDEEFKGYMVELEQRYTDHIEAEKKKEEEGLRLMALFNKRFAEISPLIKYQAEYIDVSKIAEWSKQDFEGTIKGLKLAKEAKEKADEEAEKRAKENEAKEKELKKKEDALEKKAKAEAEKKAKAEEKKRAAALKPDKVKLKAFGEELKLITYPKMKTSAGGVELAVVHRHIQAAIKHIEVW